MIKYVLDFLRSEGRIKQKGLSDYRRLTRSDYTEYRIKGSDFCVSVPMLNSTPSTCDKNDIPKGEKDILMD